MTTYQCPHCKFIGDVDELVTHWQEDGDREHVLMSRELSQETSDAAICAEAEAEEEFVRLHCKRRRL